MQFVESNISAVFNHLVTGWEELADFYHEVVKGNSNEDEARMDYVDMADIARFIVEKKNAKDTKQFPAFFGRVEEVMQSGDEYTKELIEIGLFEGIQNVGGQEIDYYRSFDKWLKGESLQSWRAVIDYWEQSDWRKTDESEAVLKNIK